MATLNESDIDLRGVIGLLRRQLKLIAGTVVVVIALAAIVIFSLTPIYTASTLVLVDPSRKNLLDPTAEMLGSSSENARIESEVEILRSDAVLLEVVRDGNLITDPEFGVRLGMLRSLMAFLRMDDGVVPSGNDALQAVMSNLRRAISVQRRGLTYLLSIQVSSRDREKAATLANLVADAYINAQVSAKIGSTLAVRDILQGQIADASAAIVRSEEAFDNFIDDNIAQLDPEGGSDELIALRRQLEEATSTSAITAQLVGVLEEDIQAGRWSAVAASLQSEAIAELERQRQSLATRLAGAAEGTQLSVDLQAELARIETGLTAAAQEESAALRQQVATSRRMTDDLRRQLRSTVLVSDLPADVLTRIYQLQQNAEIARSQYETLLARVSDVEQQSNLQVADARVVSPALTPSRPSFPNPPLFLTLAAMAALVLGVGLAFLYEHYIGGFTSEGQVNSVLRLKVAASIPRQKARSGADIGESVANQMISAPLSIYAESVRRVRAEIDQAMRAAPPMANTGPDGKPAGGKVVMISSAAPGEGKTTMALSLARAYAISGRKVLLIDADLRKPSVHKHMGVEASTGLLEYLTEPKKGDGLAGIVFKEEESNLLTLVGARRSDVPTDQLVASRSFEELIALARTHFEIVVLDTPPVGPVVDGLYLAKFADAIALVVRWANTSQRDARDAAHSLETAKRPGVPVLAILNQQEGSAASYRTKYAGYYNEAY